MRDRLHGWFPQASGALCVAWVLLFAYTAASTPERHAASGRCFRATAAEVGRVLWGVATPGQFEAFFP